MFSLLASTAVCLLSPPILHVRYLVSLAQGRKSSIVKMGMRPLAAGPSNVVELFEHWKPLFIARSITAQCVMQCQWCGTHWCLMLRKLVEYVGVLDLMQRVAPDDTPRCMFDICQASGAVCCWVRFMLPAASPSLWQSPC